MNVLKQSVQGELEHCMGCDFVQIVIDLNHSNRDMENTISLS